MAKKIQKKQIEDGVFVETKSTYTPPTQDSEYVQKKYVDEEVAKKANVPHTHSWNDITDKPVIPSLPSWVTAVKPSYNWSEIQNKPNLDFIPLSWNQRNGKTIIDTSHNDWLYLNDNGTHNKGTYFGDKIVRTDGELQVGSDGNVFRTHKENDGDGIILGNKIKIRTRDNDDHIAFGNVGWTKLVYGEFAGIKIWNNVDNNKVVLAGGGVKHIDQLTETAQYLRYVNASSLRLSDNISGRFRAGDFYNALDAPFEGWFNYFGGRHSNVNNNFSYNFAIPFQGAFDTFYFNNRIDSKQRSWTKFIGFTALNNNGLFREWNLPQGLSTYIGESGVFGVRTKLSGEGGDLILSADTTGIFGKGFKKEGSSNEKVLLGGGGDINLSELKNENIKIGGRNLLKNSGEKITNNRYNIASYKITEEINEGEIVTLTIKGELGTGKTVFAAYNSGDFLELSQLFNKGNGIHQSTFSWRKVVNGRTANNKTLFIWTYDGSVIVDNTIEWIKLERGNVNRVDWSPAPEDFDFFKGNIQLSDLNTFKNRETGGFSVNTGGGWGAYLNFKLDGSTSSLEFFKRNWYPSTRIGIRNSVDSGRFNDDGGAFRELAWYSDVYGAGAAISSNWTAIVEHQNNTIFVENSLNVELGQLQNMGSISFIKTFDGGNVTFTCAGKTIKYPFDNQFNGKDGSTAVATVYGNKCYIRISNV